MDSFKATPICHALLLVAFVGQAPVPVLPITISEVELHGSSNDCWSALYGNIYDLTEYGPSHRRGGGPDVVWSLCGTDGTSQFDSVHGNDRQYLGISSIQKLGPLTEALPPTEPPTAELTEQPTTLVPTELPTPAIIETLEPTIPEPGPTNAPTATEPETSQPSTLEPATAFPSSTAASTSFPTLSPTRETETEAPTEENTEDLIPESAVPTNDESMVESATSIEVSLQELEQHDSIQDCWVLYFDEVYDMTEYAFRHPGPGATVIHPLCGENGTDSFYSIHPKSYLNEFVRESFVGFITIIQNLENDDTQTDLEMSATELSKHDNPHDCWVAFQDEDDVSAVYNLTEYAFRHPGPGASAIHPYCGKDGSIGFDSFHVRQYLNRIAYTRVGRMVADKGDDGSAEKASTGVIVSVVVLVGAALDQMF